MLSLPGHQIPGTEWHCGAADKSKIGLAVRFASAKPLFQVPCQAIFPVFIADFGVSACALVRKGAAKKAPARNILRVII